MRPASPRPPFDPTGTPSAFEKPRWLRDMLRFLPLKPQFVLSGNVRDLQLAEVAPGMAVAQPLLAVIAAELRAAGYAAVLSYDPVSGFRLVTPPGEAAATSTERLSSLGLQPGADGAAPAGLELFTETLSRIVLSAGEPVADFASRLIVRPDGLTAPEHAAFTRALVLSHQARPRPHGTPARPFLNTVVWIADKEGDLPDWFLVGNPRVRHVPVAKPDIRARRTLAASLLRGFPGFREAAPDAAASAVDDYANATEGLPYSAVGDAVRRYKVGVTEDPWARLPVEKIRGGAEWIGGHGVGCHLNNAIRELIKNMGWLVVVTRPSGLRSGRALLLPQDHGSGMDACLGQDGVFGQDLNQCIPEVLVTGLRALGVQGSEIQAGNLLPCRPASR